MSWCSQEVNFLSEKHLQTSVYVLGGLRLFYGVLHILVCSLCLFHVAEVTQMVGKVRVKFSQITDKQTEDFLWLYTAFGVYYVISDGE
jgi:predicted house-cleaning NTP pyrophosphatase (Maf/HAM1 superfamily)